MKRMRKKWEGERGKRRRERRWEKGKEEESEEGKKLMIFKQPSDYLFNDSSQILTSSSR